MMPIAVGFSCLDVWAAVLRGARCARAGLVVICVLLVAGGVGGMSRAWGDEGVVSSSDGGADRSADEMDGSEAAGASTGEGMATFDEGGEAGDADDIAFALARSEWRGAAGSALRRAAAVALAAKPGDGVTDQAGFELTRVEMLGLASADLARLGFADDAREVLSKAVALAGGIEVEGSLRAPMQASLAAGAAAVGQLDAARTLASRTVEPMYRGRIELVLMLEAMSRGDADAAGAHREAIEQQLDVLKDETQATYQRADALLGEVILAMVKAGDVRQAARVSGLDDRNEQCHVLAQLAVLEARWDSPEAARSWLEQALTANNAIDKGRWRWLSPYVAAAHAWLGEDVQARGAALDSGQPLAWIRMAEAYAARARSMALAGTTSQPEQSPEVLFDSAMDRAAGAFDRLRDAFAARSGVETAGGVMWVWGVHDLAWGYASRYDEKQMTRWIGSQGYEGLEAAGAWLGAGRSWAALASPPRAPRDQPRPAIRLSPENGEREMNGERGSAGAGGETGRRGRGGRSGGRANGGNGGGSGSGG